MSDHKVQKSSFTTFVNQYQVPKTLRFALKPVFGTEVSVKRENVFKEDKERAQNYQKMKEFIDELHRKFIKESFTGKKIPKLNEYWRAYELLQKVEKKQKATVQKKLNSLANGIREEVVSFFIRTNEKWRKNYIKNKELNKDKKVGKELLILGKEVLDLLAKDNPKKEAKEIIDSFKGFYTYFNAFIENRKNLYKNDGKATSISYRAIDVDLNFFCKNRWLAQEQYKKQEPFWRRLTSKEKGIFEMPAFNFCLLSEGIENYNKIIGDINKKVNEYKQKNKDKKFPILIKLYRQLLSPKTISNRDNIEILEDKDVFRVLKECIKNSDRALGDVSSKIIDNFNNYNDEDLVGIWLKKRSIMDFSKRLCGSPWLLPAVIDNNKKRDDQTIKTPTKDVSLLDLKQKLEVRQYDEQAKDFFVDLAGKEGLVKSLDKVLIFAIKQEFCYLEEKRKKLLEKVKYIIQEGVFDRNKKYPKFERIKILRGGKEQKIIPNQITLIKDYLDVDLNIYRFFRSFQVETTKKDVFDNDFYDSLSDYLSGHFVVGYYNSFRNYLTKKSFSTEKAKLNFNNSQLLSGWDVNKSEYGACILRNRDGKYFLGITTKGTQPFSESMMAEYHGDSIANYSKMHYRQLNNVFRQLSRIAFASKNREKFGVTLGLENIREQYRKYQKERMEKPEISFDNKKTQALISLYKQILRQDYSNDFPNVIEVLADEYQNLNDFFRSVEKKTYNLNFDTKIKDSYIEKLTKDGRLYLFEIYNKDLADTKKGREKHKPNLHTSYFKALFSDENLQEPIFKLSGGAEVFFREASIKVADKEPKMLKGKQVLRDDKKIMNLHRYTEDRYLFHFPIVINFSAEHGVGVRAFNEKVNNHLLNNKVKILGIDRGERNLLYYALLNADGSLIEAKSLNEIDGVNYLDKLCQAEEKRALAREEWQEIVRIKNLKMGYLTHAISKIAKIALDEGAIIVLEDLNFGFKRGRMKFERQVYQNFEIALMKKLNYFIDKGKNNISQGLQLTSLFTTYDRAVKGKQNGIIFYVNARYTSAVCPQCGFRKRIYISRNESERRIKKVLSEYKVAIFFDKKDNHFRIEWLYKSKMKEIAYTDVFRSERIFKQRNRATECKEHSNLTNGFRRLCNGLKLNLSKEIIKQMKLSPTAKKADWQDLAKLLNLLWQVRNYKPETQKSGEVTRTGCDKIICPCCSFSSDKPPVYLKVIKDGDANGAYNIARRGLLVLNKLKQYHKKNSTVNGLSYNDFKISLDEWDSFAKKQMRKS